MKRSNNLGFRMLVIWVVLAMALIWVFSGAVARADEREQYKPVFPFGKTSSWITSYNQYEPVVAAFTVKPKGKEYCPHESDDYQCPADYEPIKYFMQEDVLGVQPESQLASLPQKSQSVIKHP